MAKAKILGLDREPKELVDERTKRFEQMTEQEIQFMWAQMIADLRAAKALLPQARSIEHEETRQ